MGCPPRGAARLAAPSLPYRLFAVLGVVVMAACVDETIVFRDRPLFDDPPQGSAGFLGYSDRAEKLTVCGNCHVGQQRDWVGTAHADAWASLEASPATQAFCEPCHSVNPRGNVAEGEAGGYVGTNDPRYHDVQCESCHGPGLTHVQNPSVHENQPLAPLAVGLDLSVGCGQCHTGAHQPFVEEWASSGHGRVQESPAGREACWSCHTAENALRAFGVRANYIEKEQLDQPGQHLAIVCGVCHDPHGSDNSRQLRFPIDAPSEEENLCMQCHHKRGVPDPTTFRGPHSPEGPVLLGTGGWWPPNLEFPGGAIVATHGTERNPRLCAGCHVNPITVTDPESGGFVFQSTGHTFQAIPCLDAQGIPTTEDCPIEERSFRTCTDIGCHGTEATALAFMLTVEGRIDDLASVLEDLVAQIPESEFSDTDGRYTVGEGARFNAELARFPGSGVHNPVLIEALLSATIRQVRETYGLVPSRPVSLEPVFGRRPASD